MKPKEPFAFILFGATGDLAGRKIFPVLYDLYQSQMISSDFVIIGNSRSKKTDEEFRKLVLQNLNEYYGKVDLSVWHHFEKRLFYIPGDANRTETIEEIQKRGLILAKKGFPFQNRLYYVAIIPEIYPLLVENLGKALKKNPAGGWQRVMIEKPFGTDLASAQTLNKLISRYFAEDSVFRMDHFLAKETVQNIIAFRFANGLFEPIWNRDFVDSIQITASETLGVDGREIFYDHTGTLRDVVQNHILEILGITMMDMPSSLKPEAVREKTLNVLKNLKTMSLQEREKNLVYGQYGRGIIKGEPVRAYTQEENIPENSRTETFVALKTYLTSSRWEGVPIYIRAGKRLARNLTEISLQFKDPFKTLSHFNKQMSPNVLTIRIQPEEGITLRFDAKKPGFGYQLQAATMDFRYQSSFDNAPLLEAYQRLLADALTGDHMLFPNAAGVETAWKFITPLLKDHPVEIYPAGSLGPKGADKLLERDGRQWLESK